MSYAFYLVPRSPGNALAKARAYAQLPPNSGEFNAGMQDLAKEARKQRLAAALIESNSQLAPIRFGYTAMIGKYGMTEEQARLCYREWVLGGSQRGNGVEIALYDDVAVVALPYARPFTIGTGATVAEAWRYFEVLSNQDKFAIYDAQLDKMLDLAKDQTAVAQEYAAVSARMAKPDEFKKPWWKFWSR
ncbi:hypothetical protein [Methylomagnum sp.]